MNYKEKLLKTIVHTPNWINRCLLAANIWPEAVYGSQYNSNKKLLNNLDIESRLLSVTNNAIKQVPYYQNIYRTPVASIDDFRSQIGFIDRNTVTDQYEYFKSRSIELGSFDECTTGGTSGKPLKFLVPKNRYQVELAFMHNLWNRVGWNYSPRAVLRNHSLKKNEVFRINPLTKEFIFDNFRLDLNYAKQIHSVLVKYQINYLHAYPSAAYQFCLLCREQGLDLSFLKAILCGSEGVMDFQKKIIVDELGLKLFNWYGHSEKLVLGGYCEYTDNIHIEPSYGFFELIGKDNRPIITPGEYGEIVGSTLYNFGMPFIRYRTGDFAEYVGNHCEKCGRRMPIIRNIQGRWDKNQIYKKDGTYISTTALNLHSNLYDVIDGLQYIQNAPGSLIILIIKGSDYNQVHEIEFRSHFMKAMGPDSNISIEYVDSLIFQPNGKFVQLISKI